MLFNELQASNEPRRLKRDRERTMAALMNVISSTDQLNSDVTHHNTALQNAESEIKQCESSGQVMDVQHSLIQNIRSIVQANQKMENDLVVSKFQLEETAQELDRSRKEARTDALCNVANRKAVDETLPFMVSRYHSRKKSFGLMLIDIDHFKRINDTFGHEAGDEVLINVGKALKECVRPEDFVGRLGGDEFVLMLEGLTESSAELVGRRIRSTIELYTSSKPLMTRKHFIGVPTKPSIGPKNSAETSCVPLSTHHKLQCHNWTAIRLRPTNNSRLQSKANRIRSTDNDAMPTTATPTIAQLQ